MRRWPWGKIFRGGLVLWALTFCFAYLLHPPSLPSSTSSLTSSSAISSSSSSSSSSSFPSSSSSLASSTTSPTVFSTPSATEKYRLTWDYSAHTHGTEGSRSSTNFKLPFSLKGREGVDYEMAVSSWSKLFERNAKADNQWHASHNRRVPSSEEERFLMLLPAYGPNNQYLEIIEAAVVAKTLGRTLVVLPFHSHKEKIIVSNLRPFKDTFNLTVFSQFIPVISHEEYLRRTGGIVDVVAYCRKVLPVWDQVKDEFAEALSLNMDEAAVVPMNSSFTLTMDEGGKLTLSSYEEMVDYFAPYAHQRTVALGFPFRLLAGEFTYLRFLGAMQFFQHTDRIHEIASSVLEFLQTDGPLLVLHWRTGEEGCYLEQPTQHEGFDFCSGAGSYRWFKSDDLIVFLRDIVKKYALGKIYIATDSKQDALMEKLQSLLPVAFARDVPALRAITDNYYLSLVEQNLAMSAPMFLGTAMSTWSEFVEYWLLSHDSPRLAYAHLLWLIELQDGEVLHHDVSMIAWGNAQQREFEAYLQAADATASLFEPELNVSLGEGAVGLGIAESGGEVAGGAAGDVVDKDGAVDEGGVLERVASFWLPAKPLDHILSRLHGTLLMEHHGPPKLQNVSKVPIDMPPKCVVLHATSGLPLSPSEASRLGHLTNCRVYSLAPEAVYEETSTLTILPGLLSYTNVDSPPYPLRTLPSLMKDLSLPHIHYLLLDLGGKEWRVIDSLLRQHSTSTSNLSSTFSILSARTSFAPLYHPHQRCLYPSESECQGIAGRLLRTLTTLNSTHPLLHAAPIQDPALPDLYMSHLHSFLFTIPQLRDEVTKVRESSG